MGAIHGPGQNGGPPGALMTTDSVFCEESSSMESLSGTGDGTSWGNSCLGIEGCGRTDVFTAEELWGGIKGRDPRGVWDMGASDPYINCGIGWLAGNTIGR